MRLFYIYRVLDVTPGAFAAEGVIWADGTCALHTRGTETPTTEVYESIEHVNAKHTSDGKAVVLYEDSDYVCMQTGDAVHFDGVRTMHQPLGGGRTRRYGTMSEDYVLISTWLADFVAG